MWDKTMAMIGAGLGGLTYLLTKGKNEARERQERLNNEHRAAITGMGHWRRMQAAYASFLKDPAFQAMGEVERQVAFYGALAECYERDAAILETEIEKACRDADARDEELNKQREDARVAVRKELLESIDLVALVSAVLDERKALDAAKGEARKAARVRVEHAEASLVEWALARVKPEVERLRQ